MIGLKIAEIVFLGIHTIMLAVLIYNLHAPRIRFLVGLSFFSSLFSLGHVMELFAKTDDVIKSSYVVSYIGMSFLALCYMLFAMEYRGRKRLPKIPVYLGIVICGVLTGLTIFTSTDKVFDRSDLIETFHVAPVIFAFTAWSFILLIIGDVILARFVTKYEDKTLYKYAVIFLGVVTLPVLGLLLNSLRVCEGYDLTPMSISIANSILIYYILNYRTPEWAALGRHNAIETMTDGFLLVNNINVLLDINQKVTECFPQITRQQIGKKVNDIPNFPKFLLDPAIYDFSLEIPPNGKRHFMLIRSALKTEKGKRVGQNVLMVDDTINYDITEVLRHKTQHDGLTGLYNRTAVYDIAGRDWTLSVRAKRNSCMLMFDIDFFKKVNDTYGHLIGDEVLKTLGNLLRARLRKTDIGARYGGEEFFVWVPDTNIEGAFCLAEELRKKIEELAIPINENEFLNITISIGIAELKSTYFVAKSFEKMVALTDEALYYAKEHGRNKTSVCIPNDNGDLEFVTTQEQLTFFEPILKKRHLPDMIFGSTDDTRKTKVEEMIDKL